MRTRSFTLAAVALSLGILAPALQAQAPAGEAEDPVATLVARLTLDDYKTTLKGLTRFGDRRQGTQRNRDAVDWIEAQLQGVGCTNTERIFYNYPPPPPPDAGPRRTPPRGGAARRRPGPNEGDLTTATGGRVGRRGPGSGGSTIFGYRGRTGVNRDLMAQPDERIRELNREEPVDGDRSQVYCTKVGTTRPDEMYIIGAHMDGHGVNEAVNDDGSGTALVMELARIFSAPDVQTERSIRFVLWNNEETGLNGARAYVAQRQEMQGVEDPPGSGQFPEPRWLGMIQHDMMLWDHGAPGPDGLVSRDQRPEADVNIEFQSNSERADDSMKLAFFFKAANENYATDYPAAVGPHMTNTDSTPFMDIVPAISLRENERGAQVGAGWDPNWHQPTDVWTTYTDDDFRLGLNAAQTTLAALAQLTSARLDN
ncbi:M28 family metallopeptidase [Candidatus Palauibacter sp.]|uniref:M28 family metallopeptidase n=1 Tax=Candidatus Palauibacter sp. TaxID=3101350 RepID=UPI003B52355B